MLRNTVSDWGSVAKTLHWLVVALIVTEVPAGLLMTATYGAAAHSPQIAPVHRLASQWHHTVGFLVLALAVTRLTWRSGNVTPAAAGLPVPVRRAAAVSHAALYGLLIFVPLSGWAALSVLGDTAQYGHTPIWLFGMDRVVPGILPQQPLSGPFGYGFFGRWHRWLLLAGGAVVSIHVAAALWHHFVRRDGVFARMWPLSAAPPAGETQTPGAATDAARTGGAPSG